MIYFCLSIPQLTINRLGEVLKNVKDGERIRIEKAATS